MDERTTLLVRTHLDSVNLVDEYQKLQAENERLKGENAKLKCLVLHAMRDLFDYKGHKLEFEGNKIWVKYCHKYNEFDKAYRKAKKALMEGK